MFGFYICLKKHCYFKKCCTFVGSIFIFCIMKYFSTCFLFCILLSARLTAQITSDPVFPTIDDNITITYDATQGNGVLKGVSPVYAHMGLITNESTSPSDWKWVATTWASTTAPAQMMADGPDRWKKIFNIRTFFNIPPGVTVLRLAFVFRNASGSIVGRAADGSDIFYDVYPVNGPLATRLLQPTAPVFLLKTGDQIPVWAAASKSGDLFLYDNGQEMAKSVGKTLTTILTAGSPGLHRVNFVAVAGSERDTSFFSYIIPENLTRQDPPAGTELGVQYTGNTSARLTLYAPGKQVIYAVGDFSNWEVLPAYQMRQSNDGNTWWIDVSNLPANRVTRYQFLADGTLRIADPLSELVLDPWNDPFIPAATYPNLPAYPTGLAKGIVSVLHPGKTPFNWQATNYKRPKKTHLTIYELLIRDFVATRNYQTLVDTLDYLERLGINAIELMPVNEFDGNLSWGYNPAFHKALDKFYGSPEAFKTFVDECHKRNIAVIVDVVFNHVTGSSPLAQLYWDAANNRPAASNPWLNPTARHDFNVFNDFNHESAATKNYTKNCLKYWLNEYKIDGFRFDLSKGFTQKNTIGSVSNWGVYDASRIAIWKDYNSFIASVDPTAYVILEHFANNDEEKELAANGMMLWGNMHGAYKEVALGYAAGTGTSLNGISYKDRGWAQPHLVGYMESHDEERIAVECLSFGNNVGGNNVKTLPVALKRMEMLTNLLYTVPGPKMLWQFGELGYDFSINYCENGTVNPNCRVGNKPIRWDYYQNASRRRLYDVTAALLHLRHSYDAFESTNFQLGIGAGRVRTVRLIGSNLKVYVMANTELTPQTVTANFPNTGTWYEYYSGRTLDVTATNLSVSLQPGEFRLYTDRFVPVPAGLSTPTAEVTGAFTELNAFPNPVEERVLVQFSLLKAADVQLEVRDLAGVLIYAEALGRRPAGDQMEEIASDQWSPGCYVLLVRDAEGGRALRKLIKM